MSGSGKSNTSTQQVTIPPEVLARYNSVNDQAQQAAAAPFKTYSTDPNAFVAPLTQTQQAGIGNTNAYAESAQPYFGAALGELGAGQNYIDLAGRGISNANQAGKAYIGQATDTLGQTAAAASPFNAQAQGLFQSGLGAAQPFNAQAASGIGSALAGAQPFQGAAANFALAGGQAVNPSDLNGGSIQKYLSPYLQQVLGSTSNLLEQQNQIDQSSNLGDAIRQGAFGGDRAGIAQAVLAQQQKLTNANVLSNIANQGFNTALGAAQQQQGVGLGAEQANRAALQQTGQSLLGVGGQGYQQGLGAAQAYQGLGSQLFSQGLGAGQAVQGLGQQVYGQGLSTTQEQAALGQQLFSQMMAAAQARAGLGQQQQGMAQSLQDLGTGVQGAGLAGGQAQLAAGQTQQQTQQAGQTALYNQFLQQQSYPFQVAQFLANIAEGTGALSGSTTTTTQPGGFFSDKRLKEDIEPIGKAFDGQSIVKYRYKGEPTWRIGLIAQDVEKKHPDAVGEHSGFKTVDYGKATQAAAERGKFAGGGGVYDALALMNWLRNGRDIGSTGQRMGDAVERAREEQGGLKHGGAAFAYGGSPILPGLGGSDLSGLLAAQQQMYAPFAGGGLYGAAAAGKPRGGSSYVPEASLPVSHLTVAGGLSPGPSGLQQAKTAADLAEKGAELWKTFRPKHGAANDDSANDNDDGEYRGGLIRAKHYATGGSPYSNQIDGPGLDIPNDKPDVKSLDTPGKPPGSGPSGMSDMKSAAETALAIAKIAAMFHDGGTVRRRYADGGDIDDDMTDFAGPDDGGGQLVYKPTDRTRTGQLDARGLQVDASKVDWPRTLHWLTNPGEAAGQEAAAATHDKLSSPSGRSAADLALRLVNEGPAGIAAEGIRNAMHDGTSTTVPLAPAPPGWREAVAARATRAPQPVHRAAPPGGLAPAATPDAGVPIPVQTAGDGADLALGGDQAPQTGGLAPMPDLSNVRPYKPGLGERVDQALSDSPGGDYWKGLKHGDAQSWVPLLAAIGAMGTAPTRNLGVALAAGLSGGANAYMGVKQKQAEIGRTEAGSNLLHAQAYNEMQQKAPAGMVAVPGIGADQAHSFVGYDGKPWHYELQVNATNFGALPPSANPAAASGRAPASLLTPSSQTDEAMRSQYHVEPGALPVANRARMLALNPALAQADEAAQASVQKRVGDLSAVDAQHRQLLQLGEAINDLSRSSVTGQGHGSEYRARLANIYVTTANLFGIPVDPSVTKDVSDQQIIAKIKQLTGVAIAKSNDEKAASIAHAITGVLPGGDLQPAAANEILSQLLIQTQMPRDLSQYSNNYVGRYGAYVNVEPSFQKDMGAHYDAEQRSMTQFMQSKGFAGAMGDLRSSDPAVRQRASTILDEKFGPEFHRYFTGGQ